MKKIMLGTSDAWLTSHLSQQPSKPAYYIVDCWISVHRGSGLHLFDKQGSQMTTVQSQTLHRTTVKFWTLFSKWYTTRLEIRQSTI